MQTITPEYIETRFATFLSKYAAVLKTLHFSEHDIAERVSSLKTRLDKRDFKLYGDKPINVIHGGKRITRFLIKLAFETCPAHVSKVARLRAEYHTRMVEARQRDPAGCFFSFESVYADKLKVNLRPHRQQFYL